MLVCSPAFVYFVAMGRDGEGLEAYLEAERISGGDAYQKLTTARHLLHGIGDPAKALEKVDEVLATRPEDAEVRLECRAIQGLGALFLDQSEKAVASLELMCSELASARLPSLSCDLTLVEELARRRLGVGICARYLRQVEGRARQEGESRVLEHVARIEALLP